MKAAPFEYRRAQSLVEASCLLAEYEDARLIAGGQTLVPMMAMRLARPTLLIDIGRIAEIQQITLQGDTLVIGAGVTQARAERDQIVTTCAPLLARALPLVGHAPTRNRGTVGGSVANADPAAEIPLALVTLSGSVLVQRGEGQHEVDADQFFVGPMMTALGPRDCIAALRVPVWAESAVGTAFLEVSARQSDFAYVSASAQVALDRNGCCIRCTVGIGGATPVPTRLRTASEKLIGSKLSNEDIYSATAPAIADLEIMVDAHASPAYRRRVAAAFAVRALATARDEALQKLGSGQA